MTQQKSVIDWLKDAHAMEVGGVTTLSDHAAAAQDYPEVAAKLREHAEATRRHAELLEGRLAGLGTGPSSLKEAVGAAFSKVAGVANLPASDTVVKNALGDLAAENFEIASYMSLIAAAESVDDRETAAVCEQILREEETMADWLKAQIPSVTRQFLARQAGGEGGGLLESAKETARNVGERVKDVAPDAGDTRNALLVSGALLAGAGAALLVGKALLGGSGEWDRDAETGGVPQYTNSEPEPAAADAGGYAVTGDVSSGLPNDGASDGLEGLDAGEDSLGAAPTLSDPLGEALVLGETDLNDAGMVISQDELVAETVGGDAAFLVASEPRPEETTGAPELHDGSQDEAETPEDAERR